ncbi:MAG: polysaccharide pyruvyl transferase family protein [Propionibacteriaceae bacterium]|jgi:polysaccharide pyruvyl transferase WcaK-like protein|nr:polysaccharide pyruvyl transferase family protein [Propionibacteriaceae bacterium]
MMELLRTVRLVALATIAHVGATIHRTFGCRHVPAGTSLRVLLIGAYGNGNYGDDIVGEAIASALRYKYGATVRIAARQHNIANLTRDVAPTTFVGGGIRSVVRTWRLARGADVVILGGGGLLDGGMDDVHSSRLQLEYLAKLMVCATLRARLVIFGIGISPSSNYMVRSVMKHVLANVDWLGVREEVSFNYAKNINANAQLICDPAAVLLRQLAQRLNITQQPRNGIGVVLLDEKRWPAFVPSTAKVEQQRTAELADLADMLVVAAGDKDVIKLVCFHSSDVAIMDDLSKILIRKYPHFAKRVAAQPYPREHSRDAFAALMHCRQVYAMRFHPALAALISGVEVQIVGKLQKLVSLRTLTSDDGYWWYPAGYGDPVFQLGVALNLPAVTADE